VVEDHRAVLDCIVLTQTLTAVRVYVFVQNVFVHQAAPVAGAAVVVDCQVLLDCDVLAQTQIVVFVIAFV